jgi:plastocyanin
MAVACVLAAASAPLDASRAQTGAISGTITAAKSAASDVVVFLVKVAPSGAAHAAPVSAEVDQRSLSFVPGVIAVSPGSTVTFTNSDHVMHNVFHPPKGGNAFDLGLFGPGERRSVEFGSEGAYVIFCHVHPEMSGYVVVLDTPWRTVSNDSGRFAFADLPAGSYELRTWAIRFDDVHRLVAIGDNERTDIEVALTRGSPGEPRVVPRAAPR